MIATSASSGESHAFVVDRGERPGRLDRFLADKLRESGLSLLVISHRLEHTLRFSDRILGLANGRIALDLATRRADEAGLRQFFDHADAA